LPASRIPGVLNPVDHFGTLRDLRQFLLILVAVLGRRLLRLFIELNRSGTAVIIATHDITLMDQYEARRLVLHQGRLHIYE